ncbi:MAG TPA: lysophospholipid acyltransferase family protein [Bacteroidales bacterium]|nr:lysophospholipid acyltransferase family protein [Bacteroidales bacterium]
MILKARHHVFIYPFFMRYAVFITKRYFRKVNVIGNIDDKGLPILIIANHISWWDGFWIAYLNETLFLRKFHFMMLEEQLRKYWFFNYAGGFSVRKGSRTVVETLRYTSELLQNSGNLVLVFPQGEIQSMHDQHFVFEKGIERVIPNRHSVQVIMVANLVDYFSQKKPSLTMYLEEYTNSVSDHHALEARYNAFYKECVTNQSLRIE